MSEIWSDAEEEEEFMDTSEPTTPHDTEREAEVAKDAGNEAYKKQDYYAAITHYTNAINLTPERAAYYGNRSAAYMMVKNYNAALEDAQKSVDKDPAFFKGSLRIIKCYIAMGNLLAASRSLEDLKSRDSSTTYAGETTNITRLREYEAKAEKEMGRSDYRQVVFTLEQALKVAPACTRYKTQRAECLALLGRYAEAQEASNDLLRANNLDAGPLYVKGLCLFYQDNLDKARQHFLQVLRVDPDHSKARKAIKDVKSLETTKQQGNDAFQGGRNEDALKLYTEALKICPHNKLTNAKLHGNLAAVHMKLKNWADALKACNSAINLDDTYVKAYARRISCYQELDQHDDAVRDAEHLHKIERSRESKQRVRDAQIRMKKAKRKDYYKILGISQNASEEEIKKGYKKSALAHHPDRHASKNDEEKAEEEKKFKEVGEAYAVLSDPQKKMRYDNGEDLDDPMSGMHDASQMFQTFFGGGGSGVQFSFGGAGGGSPFGGGGHHGDYTFHF